jgi:hypothetical protein
MVNFFVSIIARVATLTIVSIVLAISAVAQQNDRQLVQNATPTVTNGKRIALVIGNGAYATAPPLKNPPNDARDMAAALKTLGFDVSSGVNLTQREMKQMIREFGAKLKNGGSGLFYYAGHGVQSRGRNYLIPVDANIQSEAEVEDSGVDAALVLNFMDDAQNGLNIVILDACRNNPFARSFRSANDGLAQVDAPTGTLIAYATAPGRVASDGANQNGLYTSELLKQMQVPGLSVTDMFMRVRAEVMRQTGNKQVPWEASSLVGSFYFAGAPNSSTVTNTAKIDPVAFELSYWETIKNSTSADDFKAYLARYPQGQFAELAKNRVATLGTATKPAETSSPATSGGSATELAFWDAIKNSTSADDYRAYLEKYPTGEFAGLARRRLAPLEANEKERAKADELVRNTKIFKGRFGIFGYTSYNNPGRLIVTPNEIRFVYDDGVISPSTEKQEPPDILTCAALDIARVEGQFIREIREIIDGQEHSRERFQAESPQAAADAMAAIRYVCANPGKNFASAGTERATETADPNAKIFGGYLGVMSAGFSARPGKMVIAASGIQFVWDKGTAGIAESKGDGLTGSKAVDYKLHPDPAPTLLQCSYFTLARTDGFFIREINTSNPAALTAAIGWGGAVVRFRASSPTEAAAALAAVREVCSNQQK